MIRYNKQKYSEVISESTIHNIEESRKIKCLFGGAFSTYVYAIDNYASDLDFYLIYDNDKQKADTGVFRCFDEDTMIDFYMLDWKYVQESSQAYLEKTKKYPSVLYRGNRIQQVFNCNREDFTSQVIFEILYSDYIWDSGFLMGNMDNILHKLSYIGILDYYFSRAYGNLNNNLIKERVPVVKYLMAFLGFACMKWLLNYQTIPNMEFASMVRLFAPSCYIDFLTEALTRQRSLDAACTIEERGKRIAVIPKNIEFNNWLEQELEVISHIIGRTGNVHEKIYIKKGNSAFLFRE